MKTLQLIHKENYIIVEIDNGKVNAISTSLSRELKETFSMLESDSTIKGAILTGRPHCFSAGLDVMQLATLDTEGSKEFWREYMAALQAMIHFSKPFVCAITGYAPAGATIFTICADYRIMGKGPKHVIGMHEFKMSMQIPEMLCDIYAYQLGEKNAWKAVQEARLFNSDQAKEVGLVDESVEVENVLERAESQLKKRMQVYGPVYKQSKAYFRKDLLKIVDREIEPLVEEIIRFNSDPYLRKMTENFLTSLKK